MTSSQFLEAQITKNREYLERGLKSAEGVPLERLNHCPVGENWSPARIYRHLILSNTPYVEIFRRAVNGVPLDSHNSEPELTWFGRNLAKMAGPGTNVPAPKAFEPPEELQTEGVVKEWGDQYLALIELMEQCKGKNLNQKFTRNPMVKVFRMNLADCILLITQHTQRHIEQIEERI